MKNEAAGSIAIAQRAISDLEDRLAERRGELAELERIQEARRKFEAAIAERDAAALRVAATTDVLLAQLGELDAARDATLAARDAVGGPAAKQQDELPPEPPAFADAWGRLLERSRADLDKRLDEELLEAAARSPFGHGIKELPEHLRAAAERRRYALIRAAREARRERTEEE